MLSNCLFVKPLLWPSLFVLDALLHMVHEVSFAFDVYILDLVVESLDECVISPI